MILFLVAVLVLLWLLGMVTSYTLGGALHILLVIAVIFSADQTDPRTTSVGSVICDLRFAICDLRLPRLRWRHRRTRRRQRQGGRLCSRQFVNAEVVAPRDTA